MRPLATLCVLSLACVACSETADRPPAGAGVVFDAPNARPLVPAETAAPLYNQRARPTSEQTEVIERILADADTFFARSPPPLVLDEAESVFFATGRIGELLDLYRQQVEAERSGESLRPRLAWLYQRVGLYTAALEQADLARQSAPDSPDAWFVYGFVLGQASDGDLGELAVIRDAYTRVVDLDPTFSGPGGVTAADLRQQVAELAGSLDHDH